MKNLAQNAMLLVCNQVYMFFQDALVSTIEQVSGDMQALDLVLTGDNKLNISPGKLTPVIY